MLTRILTFVIVFTLVVPALATSDLSFTLGDFNEDGGVDAADIDLLFGEISAGTNRSEFDLTGDAMVDRLDANELVCGILGTEYGDATLDRAINGADLSILAGNWLTSGRGWASGDFTGDGAVGGADMSLMASNWLWTAPNNGGPAGHAPEPVTMATVGLSILVAGGLARRRSRKSSAL